MNQPKVNLIETLPLPFLLSLPPSAGEAEGAGLKPVLFFLHGLMEGPPTEIRPALTAHGPLSPRSSPLASAEFLVAAPQLPARGDIWRSYADVVCEIAGYLHANCGGDPGRTYLTGFSFGANGVFDLALFAPSLWAALWAVDPTRVPESDPGIPVWLSSGEASRFRARGFIDRLRLAPPGTGSEDRVYLDEGLDHVGTATSAYRSDRVYRWLLERRC